MPLKKKQCASSSELLETFLRGFAEGEKLIRTEIQMTKLCLDTENVPVVSIFVVNAVMLDLDSELGDRGLLGSVSNEV